MRKLTIKHKLMLICIGIMMILISCGLLLKLIKPEIILQNDTTNTIFVSSMQNEIGEEADSDEILQLRKRAKLQSQESLKIFPDLMKLKKNDLVWYVEWITIDKKGVRDGQGHSFLIHDKDRYLSIKDQKTKEITPFQIFYTNPKQTTCRIRIVINEKDYEVIPEKKWYCLKSLTPIRFIYAN